jgi:hypothetical protein
MKTPKSSASFWRQLFMWSAGSINLMILLILISIWRTGDRTLSFINNLFQLQPIEPRIENSAPIMQRIKNIQELATTVQTMETIVPVSADRRLGDIPLATTRLLYVARGEIRAGVDLNELTDADIKVSNDSIKIDLPPAKILDSKIDVNRSRVYDYDRGFLNLGPDVAPQLQTLAQRKTLVEIVNTACKEGILEDANNKAKQAIGQLLVNTGYKVQIETRSPKSCTISNSSSSQAVNQTM